MPYHRVAIRALTSTCNRTFISQKNASSLLSAFRMNSARLKGQPAGRRESLKR